MLKVGLTGNIGSGKSLVAHMFTILHIPVFDADEEAKKLYRNEAVKQELRSVFSDRIFTSTGEIDKKALAQMIFNDKAAISKINEIIHPAVRQRFITWSGQFTEAPYLIYEAAVIIESGYSKKLDRVVLVTAPEETRIGRVMKRDEVQREDVVKRMKNQWPEKRKKTHADFLIDNSGNRMLIPQVLEIHEQLSKHSGGST